MFQFTPKLLNLDESITYYGDSDRYELIDGKYLLTAKTPSLR